VKRGNADHVRFDGLFHRVALRSCSATKKGSRQMFLPAQYAWFEPVLIAAIVVFVIDLIGNTITFSNRFANALVSAVIFALVFGALVYFGYGGVSMTVSTTPVATAPVNK
jgi:hypothetical protein